MKKGKRFRRFWAFLLAMTMLVGQVLGSAQLTVRAEEGIERNVYIYAEETELREGEYSTWLFVGETQTFMVDVSQLDVGDDHTVEWRVGEVDAVDNGEGFFEADVTEPVSYEVSEDGHAITITGTAASNRLRADVYVKVNEEEIASATLWFEVREEVYDYQFSVGDDWSMLPHWTHGINRYNNCYIENPEYPYGEKVQFEVIDCTVANAEEEGTDYVVASCNEWEDGNGWELRMERFGHAIGTLKYLTVDGEEATKTFNLWGCDSIYNVDAWSDTGTWEMLPETTMNVTPQVWRDCYNEEDGHFQGDTSDVVFEWSYGANDENWEEAFEVSVDEETQILTVNSKAESMDRSLWIQLRAYVPNEEGELEEVAYRDWWVESRWGYIQIVMSEEVNTDLAVGETTVLAPQLWEHAHNEEGNHFYEVTQNLQYAVEFDTNTMQITDANDKILTNEDNMGTAPFTVKKLENWSTDINLLAMQLHLESGEWNETIRTSWHFNEQNYDVWFEELRGEDHTWIFASAEDENQNEEYELRLNTDNLNNMEADSYQIVWSIGQYDENIGHIPFDNLEDAYQVSEDGKSIILYAGELRSKFNELLDREAGDTAEIWMDVRAQICVGETILAETGTGIGIKETREEYQLPTDIAILPDTGHGIDRVFNCYMENKDFPQGENSELEILDITVENAEDEMAEEPVAVCNQWEDENGWNIDVQRFGHAVATVTFMDLNGEEATHTIQIWGCDALYYVEADINKQTWNLLPGESLEVTPRAWADFYHEEGNYTEDVTDVTYQWTIGANDSNYAEAFEVTEDEETGVLTVTALPGGLDRNVQLELRAYRTDENGELYEVAYNSWDVNCYGSYHEMVMTEEVNTQLPVGSETILAPEVWEYGYREGEIYEYQITENLQYAVEFDTNAMQVTDAEGKILTNEDNMGTAPFTLKKIENGGTEVNLLAMQLDENQEWQEVVRQSWYFDEQNYDVWFEDLRGGDHTWIFTSAEDEGQNEEYVLQLNTDNLNEAGDYHIVWSVGQYDDNIGHIPFDNLEDAYQVSEDGRSITLYAGKLRSKFNELLDREAGDTSEIWMDVRAQVCVGETILTVIGTGVGIKEAREEYPLPTDIPMLPGTGYGIDRVFNYYMENKDFPQGENVELEILNITVENAEDEMSEDPVAVCNQWEDGSGWQIDVQRFGHAIVTITYTDIRGEEANHIIQIWGSDALYYVDAYSNTETWNLLPGESLEVIPRAWADFYHINGNYTEDVTDITYRWTVSVNESNYEEFFEVTEDEETGVLTVTALPGALDRNLQVELRGYRTDENGELYEVAYNSWWIDCCSVYSKLVMASEVNTNLMPGQETTLEPQIWQYNHTEAGNEAVQITGVRWEVEFDPGVVQITDAEGNILDAEKRSGMVPFTVKKLTNDETNIDIVAMAESDSGDWFEWGRRDFHFNNQDYNIGFENLREEGYSWIFASEDNVNENEDYTVTLNTSNIAEMPKDAYEIRWRLGYWDEAGEFLALAEDGGAYDVEEDGTSIVLHSGEVRSQLKSLMGMAEDDRSNIWFELEAHVMVGENKISMTNTSIEVCQPEYDRHRYNGAYGIKDDIALNDSMFYENAQIECYVRNKDYPYGEVVPFTITGIDVENREEREELVFEVHYNEEDNSWAVVAANCGSDMIWYHVSHDIYGEMDFGQDLTVLEEVYRMNVWLGDTNQILQGATKEITLEGVRCYYDEATGEIRCDIMDISECNFTVTSLNEEMIVVSPVENGKFTITANEGWWGEALFDVRFQPTENPDYAKNGEVPVYVTDSYYLVCTEEVIAVPGEKVEIPVVLKRFDLEHPEGIEIEDATYRLEGYGSDKLILDETGTGVTVAENAATVEDATTGYMVRCIAEATDQWGNPVCEEATGVVIICEHKWEETARTEATCTEKGSVTYQCSKCESANFHTEKTEEIPSNGHTAGEWATVKEATCTEKGSKEQKCTVGSKVLATEEIAAKGHNAGEWATVKDATCTEKGNKEQKCTVCSKILATEEIAAKGHTFGEWKVTTAATVLKEGVSTRTCACGAKETKSIAKKKGTVKLNVKNITLQEKKSTDKVKVTEITKGDSVAKWTSSNTKVATVNAKGKITGKKAGTAKITVTTKSGATATVTVKVQKKAVTTQKITVTGKNVVIKKNKLALKKGKSAELLVTLTPLTSTDKVTYSVTAKDKKIISVSGKGKIKAKKAGTAKVTVKSGKKKVVITVTVKK